MSCSPISSYYRAHDDPLSDPGSRQSLLPPKAGSQRRRIGILHGDKVIALRPVKVHSDDYALQEYGVAEEELDSFVKRMDRQIARERKTGTVKRYSGNLEADLAD